MDADDIARATRHKHPNLISSCTGTSFVPSGNVALTCTSWIISAMAKEVAVYRHINARIHILRPGFNVGISAGTDGESVNRWCHPYRHWRFAPAESEVIKESTRRYRAARP